MKPKPDNLFALLVQLCADETPYYWPGNGACASMACMWLRFDSSWRQYLGRIPLSHANRLDPDEAASLRSWWENGGEKEYRAFTATWPELTTNTISTLRV